MSATRRGEPSDDDGGGFVGQDDLALALSDFARTAQQQKDLHSTLVAIVQAAIELVPGCDEASISVVLGRKKARSEAASGELPNLVDKLQEAVGGPCMDAAYEQETVRVADMATEQRWPKFTEGALKAGAAGMLSFQLYVEGDDLGALNLFSRTAGAFGDESEHIGLMLASHAAVAYAGAHQLERLRRAVGTRELIGQAQGILMERHKLTAHRAFELLVQTSQARNVKLLKIAEHLVHSGDLTASS